MLKKILVFFYFIATINLSNCMEIVDNTLFEDQGNPEEFYFESIEKLFAQNNQKAIIDFLSKHESLVSKHMVFILDLAFQKQFSKTITYLKNAFALSDKDLILYADETGNIQWIKQFIQFDNYIDMAGKLKRIDLIDYLYSLGLNGSILDKIFAYNGINYLDDNGNRYLQTLIRANHEGTHTSIILMFIEFSTPEELNSQEPNGSTALHEVAKQWENSFSKAGQNLQQSILETLLRYGADPKIADKNQKKFSDALFFKHFPEKCRKLHEEFKSTVKNQQEINPIDTQIRKQFNLLIVKQDQNKIVAFLERNHIFADENLSYILEVVSRNKFSEVSNFIKANYNIDLKDQIICAAHLNDIEEVKRLTYFKKFAQYGKIFDEKAYLSLLKTLDVPAELVLDKIIASKLSSTMRPRQQFSNSKAIKSKGPNLFLDIALVSILGLTALYISHKMSNPNHNLGSICSYS